jgi:hypothetical protein
VLPADPGQSGALVALVAGSRRYRHDGKRDSLLATARGACSHGERIALSPARLRRIALYVGKNNAQRSPDQALLPVAERAVAVRPALAG